MAIFRTHREAAQRNNRTIAVFFKAMAMLTALFAAAVSGRYLFGWW